MSISSPISRMVGGNPRVSVSFTMKVKICRWRSVSSSTSFPPCWTAQAFSIGILPEHAYRVNSMGRLLALMVTASVALSCNAHRFEGGVFEKEGVRYRVGELALSWRLVRVEGN